MPTAPKIAPTAKIIPHLWFVEEAVEAATFYVSLFPDSRIVHVSTIPVDTPGGRAGSLHVVEFFLAGQPFTAFSGGPFEPFNHAISFLVACDDQAEIDRLWEALSDDGTVEQCGWVRDRYGVCWQIVPASLGDMMRDPDRGRAKRTMEAMLGMTKIDLARLEEAYEGASGP